MARIHKGLYTLSSTLPGVSPVHEFEIAMAIANPAAISHWSALHYYALTEQIPRRIFILTTTTQFRSAQFKIKRDNLSMYSSKS